MSLSDLDQEVSGVIGAAWAPNTKSTRNSQWRKYITFCVDNGLVSVPADPQTVSRFLVYLARSVKYSTINNYVSAINKLHEYYGHQGNFRDVFMVQLVLSGLKRRLGDTVLQKMPLTTTQLLHMYRLVSLDDDCAHAMWCGIVLSFRTLLRKSNIVPNTSNDGGHVLTRKDVVFTKDGMLLRVSSSKTIQHGERVLEIPVLSIPGSPFCAVTFLKEHFARFPMPGDSLLLYRSTAGSCKPILYRELLDFLKLLVRGIGLNPGDVGLHSLRRSGCAFLHSINIPLEDIKCVGDWKSLAVLSYLVTPVDRKLSIENAVSRALAGLSV